MRWLVAAAALLVAVLLFLLLRDDAPAHRESERREGLEKKDFWRKQGGPGGGDGSIDAGAESHNRDGANPDVTPPDPVENIDLNKVSYRLVGSKIAVTVTVVFEDGAPAPDAEASIWPSEEAINPPPNAAVRGTTDRHGLVTLDAWIGTMWISARRGGLSAGPLRIQHAREGQRATLVLGEPFAIRGIVLKPDGEPAAKAWLSVNFWDGFEYRFVEGRASTEGTFELPPVPLRWIDRMHIYVVPFEEGPRCLFEFDKPSTDLRLQLTSETVRGRVVWENGQPASNIQVDTSEKAYRTDGDGRFEVALPRREGAVLRVNHTARVLKATDAEIEIVLKPGKPLSGRLLTHDRKPVAQAWLALSLPVGGELASAGTETDGRFRFLGFTGGPHTLRVRLRDAKVDGVTDSFVDYFADVQSAEQLAEIVLPQPLRATIRLLDENRTPVKDTGAVTLLLWRDRTRVLKRVWPEDTNEIAVLVWTPGEYGASVNAANYVPARLKLRVTAAGSNVFDLPVKRSASAR